MEARAAPAREYRSAAQLGPAVHYERGNVVEVQVIRKCIHPPGHKYHNTYRIQYPPNWRPNHPRHDPNAKVTVVAHAPRERFIVPIPKFPVKWANILVEKCGFIQGGPSEVSAVRGPFTSYWPIGLALIFTYAPDPW